MEFPSKRDGWITVSIVGSSVILFAAAVSVLLSRGTAGRLLLPLFFLAVAAFSMSLLLNTRYVVDGEELLIRSGPMRWRVDIRTITRVAPTNDPTSSPALSLDRVRVDYAKNGKPKWIVVSPADRDRFIAALRERNPAIQVS